MGHNLFLMRVGMSEYIVRLYNRINGACSLAHELGYEFVVRLYKRINGACFLAHECGHV